MPKGKKSKKSKKSLEDASSSSSKLEKPTLEEDDDQPVSPPNDRSEPVGDDDVGEEKATQPSTEKVDGSDGDGDPSSHGGPDPSIEAPDEEEEEETYGLSIEKVEEARKAYSLFQDASGSVKTCHIPMILRATGRNPTESQIQELLDSAKGKDTISFSQLLCMLSELKDLVNLRKIKDSLALFDKERSGKIGMGELMHSLATLGDKLSLDEMEAMVNAADPDEENKTVIADFLKVLMET